MKVIIEIDGKPSEVAALAREIAGRHDSHGYFVRDIDRTTVKPVGDVVTELFETLEKRSMV